MNAEYVYISLSKRKKNIEIYCTPPSDNRTVCTYRAYTSRETHFVRERAIEPETKKNDISLFFFTLVFFSFFSFSFFNCYTNESNDRLTRPNVRNRNTKKRKGRKDQWKNKKRTKKLKFLSPTVGAPDSLYQFFNRIRNKLTGKNGILRELFSYFLLLVNRSFDLRKGILILH